MAGSQLSLKIRASNPELFPGKARKQHKGWLKVLATANPDRLMLVEVEGWKEPCYCNTDAPPEGNLVAPPKAVKQNQDGPAEELTPQEVLERVGEENCQAIFDEVILILREDCGPGEAIEGSKVGKALSDKTLPVVDLAKEKLGVRGWLRKVLDNCAEIDQVMCSGTQQRCYILVERRGESDPVLAHAPTQADGEPLAKVPKLGLTPEQAQAKIADQGLEDDINQMCAATLEILSEDPRSVGCGYIVGSMLDKALGEKAPKETAKVKNALGKGWVRHVLSYEPQIEPVDVHGKNEPCFRICGTEVRPLSQESKPMKPEQNHAGGKNGFDKKVGFMGKGKSWEEEMFMQQMMQSMFEKGLAVPGKAFYGSKGGCAGKKGFGSKGCDYGDGFKSNPYLTERCLAFAGSSHT